MPDISKSVGKNGGVNHDADVLTVQTLLNMVPVAQAGAEPVLDLDGWCLTKTTDAITAFQKRQFGTSDGRVDPGGKTITALNTLAAALGSRTTPLPDKDPADLAVDSIPQAAKWGNDALDALNNKLTDPLVLVALLAHFRITPLDTHRLGIIKGNFDKALKLLAQGKAGYRSVFRRQMVSDLQGKSDPGYSWPGSRKTSWTPLFHVRTAGQVRPGMTWAGDGFGPKCRAAMVLHEPIHAVDAQASYDVYEWGAGYTTMSADRCLHNASNYPSFAAHVSENSPLPLGPRYGVGREAE